MPFGVMWRRCSGQTWTRSSSRIAVPSARNSVTMRSICRVFHSTTALDSRLRQLALFMIISKSEVRKFALIGEEQPPGQTMASLSAVELGLDAQAQRSIVQVAQDVA